MTYALNIQGISPPVGRRNDGGRVVVLAIVFGLLLLALSACAPLENTPPVVKIGLIAPFEGPSRPLGYSALNGVRLRLQQWNDAGNSPRVELVALNDNGDPDLAAVLPEQLAVDPDLLLVLGPPQGHTALAALPALTKNELPTLSLAPLPDDSSPWVQPYAGVDADMQAALARYAPEAPVARELPLAGPSIWVGDAQTLAGLVQATPEMAPAAGVVAAEPAFAAWAAEAADGMVWALAVPDDLPPDFAASYQALAGSPPQPLAALAYAATDRALQLIATQQERSGLASDLNAIPAPPIQVFQRQGGDCCLLLSPDF
ncbi:MAG TPA: amino acid ABC transporter substrate-binding protein [Caldilineae bacterium]|nr:amino acid ABC transporter substrate-binding protein [Caldilineae bacterium]